MVKNGDNNIFDVLKNGETQTAEFKTSFSDETIISLAAFSNAKGGAVYVGVTDNGEIKGVALGKETIAQWINDTKNKTAPAIIPDVETFEIEGKTIVRIFAQEYPVKPVSFKGRYYKRIKNANQLLATTEVVNMHLQALNTSWDSYPNTVHSLDDISLDKVQNVIEEMRKNGLTICETPVEFLQKKNLLREGKLTNAAYLLFKTNDSYLTSIEMGHFQTPTIVKDTARTKADVLTEIEDVLTFVRKHINKRIFFTGEARRIEKWQYPMEAIREIVVNMIIHRDYRSSADSIVKIFGNKIEFYNPGLLPDEITMDDLLAGAYKSIPRNKLIADICKDMRIIEKYGSGIGRIRDCFKSEGLPEPIFEIIAGGFQVTVFGDGLFMESC
jgi:ATP-dependent DNA helicase RecG